MAPKPEINNKPKYILTQNTAKTLVMEANGVLPLKLKYELRQSDFTTDGAQLNVNVDIVSTEDGSKNMFKFMFQPSDISGQSVYALKITDGNGAKKTSFMNVEVIQPPTYSFLEVDENHNEIILTEGHEKSIHGELEGYEPLTFFTMCENKPAKIEVTSANSESEQKTKAAFKAVLPTFSQARQELIPCVVSLKDGNGAEQSSKFYIRVAPLPGFDFGNGANAEITATVGYLGSTKIPKSYGYTPMSLKLVSGDDDGIIAGDQGVFVTHPDKDTSILNVMTEKIGTTNIGLFLIDANGIKGNVQNIRLTSVNPPTIKLEDKSKHSNILVEKGQTMTENIPVIISGYKELTVTATSSRIYELPNANIIIKHGKHEITTTSGNDSMIHESRHITIKIPPGETPIVSTITLIVTDYNGGNSTAATFSVVRKGPKKKSKYELWKEKQRL
jgi:hypothetical protein